MSHVTHTNESCHVTHMNASCHTYEGTHTVLTLCRVTHCISLVTLMNEFFHTYKSHMNVSCHTR